MVWTDNLHQGFVRLMLTPQGGQADFVAVDTVLSRRYRTRTIKSYALRRAEAGLALEERRG